jgi:hypothetical protein
MSLMDAGSARSSATTLTKARKAAERTLDRAADTAKRAKTQATKMARDVADTVRDADNRTKAGVAAAILGVTAAAVTLGRKRRH